MKYAAISLLVSSPFVVEAIKMDSNNYLNEPQNVATLDYLKKVLTGEIKESTQVDLEDYMERKLHEKTLRDQKFLNTPTQTTSPILPQDEMATSPQKAQHSGDLPGDLDLGTGMDQQLKTFFRDYDAAAFQGQHALNEYHHEVQFFKQAAMQSAQDGLKVLQGILKECQEQDRLDPNVLNWIWPRMFYLKKFLDRLPTITTKDGFTQLMHENQFDRQNNWLDGILRAHVSNANGPNSN